MSEERDLLGEYIANCCGGHSSIIRGNDNVLLILEKLVSALKLLGVQEYKLRNSLGTHCSSIGCFITIHPYRLDINEAREEDESARFTKELIKGILLPHKGEVRFYQLDDSSDGMIDYFMVAFPHAIEKLKDKKFDKKFLLSTGDVPPEDIRNVKAIL